MKILIISQYFWPENFKINDLAFSLKGKGHEVSVLTGIPNYPKGRFYKGYSVFSKRKEDLNGIKIYRVPIISRRNASGWRLFLNYLSFVITSCFFILFHKKKYDTVFVFATSPITVAFPAILYKKLHKKRVVLWVLDLWPESVSAASKLKNSLFISLVGKMVCYIYSKMDEILVSSKGFIESILEKNVPLEKIHYIPNWAEEYFENPVIDKLKYKGIIPNGFIAMFTGNIGEAQDCESICNAAKYLQEHKYENIQIVMVGDGRKKGWMEQQVKQDNLSNIHFMGAFPMGEMPSIATHANVIIVTLKDEYIFSLTAPTRIQTSLALGKPIVTMLNGEGSQIVDEAHAGFTNNAKDYKSFALSLIKMSQMSIEEQMAMGNSGKQYYKSHFSRSMVIDNIELWIKEAGE